MKTCPECSSAFEWTTEDQAFLERVSPVVQGTRLLIDPPQDCPPCCQQRRLAWRNERSLYKRTCDATGKSMVSIYRPETDFTVYSNEYWYGNSWDPCDYGQEYDFNRPFFEQFRVLQLKVPRLALNVLDVENSPYVNQVWHMKNGHLSFDVGYSEDMYYCYCSYHSQSCLDVIYGEKNELSAYLINCKQCYHSVYLQNCKGVSDSFFSSACQNSRNLLFCENLSGQEYCIRNEKVSPEAFQAALEALQLGTWSGFQGAVREFEQRKSQAIQREHQNINVEDCTGDFLFASKNCQDSYECYDAEDCVRISRGDHQIKDCRDCDHLAEAELQYAGISMCGFQNAFGYMYYNNENCYYNDTIMSCQHLFGCCNMEKKRYCILNKQYSQADYEALLPKIVDHMRSTGEWGSFFPPAVSPFAYNETLAMKYYPLEREEALSQGFQWSDFEAPPPEVEKVISAAQLPDAIGDIPDDILNWAITCEVSGKPFRLVTQELAMYRQLGLPVPRRHPDVRFEELQAYRNPRQLWKRHCDQCQREIQSSFAPDRPETVYCQDCYRKEVY